MLIKIKYVSFKMIQLSNTWNIFLQKIEMYFMWMIKAKQRNILC